jgi:hypothetical protein
MERGRSRVLHGLIDEEVVIRAAEGWPEPVFYGKDSARSFFEGLEESIGHDSAIESATGAGPVLRKGKAVLLEYYWDHQEALEAAGLSD